MAESVLGGGGLLMARRWALAACPECGWFTRGTEYAVGDLCRAGVHGKRMPSEVPRLERVVVAPVEDLEADMVERVAHAIHAERCPCGHAVELDRKRAHAALRGRG